MFAPPRGIKEETPERGCNSKRRGRAMRFLFCAAAAVKGVFNTITTVVFKLFGGKNIRRALGGGDV
jgi:hypothetical protein